MAAVWLCMLRAKVVVLVKVSTPFCVQNELLPVDNSQAVTRQPVIACHYNLLAATVQAPITDSTFALVKQNYEQMAFVQHVPAVRMLAVGFLLLHARPKCLSEAPSHL